MLFDANKPTPDSARPSTKGGVKMFKGKSRAAPTLENIRAAETNN